jgi:hypothetical protein
MAKKYDGSPAEFLAHSLHEPARLGVLAVDCLKEIVAGQGPFRLRAHLTITVIDPSDADRGGALDLMITTSAPDLAEIIIAADAAGKLRAEKREVLVHTDFFIQTRVVLFIEDRIVGQIFAGPDKQSLRLDIAEPHEAWDIGKGLLSLIEPNHLPFKVDVI